ncbi:MAG: hypothetical protein HY904_10775 [Deltaproteobacteria bacterium]|nr:hypothetical protein [Deltaproteobacteria bacterium]
MPGEAAVREGVARVNRRTMDATVEDLGSRLHAPPPLRVEAVLARWQELKKGR